MLCRNDLMYERAPPLFVSLERCTFETAAVLLTLVSLGKLMEAIAKGQVMALRQLIGQRSILGRSDWPVS